MLSISPENYGTMGPGQAIGPDQVMTSIAKGTHTMVKVEAVGLKTFEAEKGQRLVLAIEDAGIDILHRCGGHARCTTCRVEIVEGDAGAMTPQEKERLAREKDLGPHTRLSCQVLVETPLKVQVLRRLSETDLSDAGPRPDDKIPTD